MPKTYHELLAWQKALDLVVAVNPLLDALPARERFRLTDQLGRSAVRVALTIAEGQGRKTSRDFCHYLVMSRGSLREVQGCLDIIERLKYCPEIPLKSIRTLANKVSWLTHQLMESLQDPRGEAASNLEGEAKSNIPKGRTSRQSRVEPPPRKSSG